MEGMSVNPLWQAFDGGRTIGGRGSEEGVILLDDEHDYGARVTLERDGRHPFAITCGIYGWMLHTVFFSDEAKAYLAFAEMRAELDRIVCAIPLDGDHDQRERSKATFAAIAQFAERYR
jgi:hypothetical protein